jgi:DNA-binding MarR family transcriptional regulator
VPSAVQDKGEVENERIMLSLLESVERDGTKTQRRLAADLQIALGLVNAYLKRCVRKGLVKVHEVPVRRYAYYLTPKGFAEKSRLTVQYLSYSFEFFRQARSDCAATLDEARARGWHAVVLAGVSDLAEIAIISALESDIDIIGILDAVSPRKEFVGRPVVAALGYGVGRCDGLIVTDLVNPQATFDATVKQFGTHRVLAPAILRVRTSEPRRAQ